MAAAVGFLGETYRFLGLLRLGKATAMDLRTQW